MKTIPENPLPGERYAEQAPGCDLWHLMHRKDGRLGVSVPFLSESDARLLIYGPAAVAAARRLLQSASVALGAPQAFASGGAFFAHHAEQMAAGWRDLKEALAHFPEPEGTSA